MSRAREGGGVRGQGDLAVKSLNHLGAENFKERRSTRGGTASCAPINGFAGEGRL